MTGKTSVVVIGGGYSGAMAASRLTQYDEVAVTLINPRAQFVDRIRLHQRVAGTATAIHDYRQVLNDKVELIIDSATMINTAEQEVVLAGGGTIGYDFLIYAVGSTSSTTGVDGAAEFSYPIASLEEAQRLQSVLAEAAPDAAITIVGGGPLGIETAAELAEQGRQVTLLCGGPLGPSLHPNGRRSVARQLDRLGVQVIDGVGSEVTRVRADAVELANGDVQTSAVTVWTAGFSVPELARSSGLSTDAIGRMITDETLTSIDDPRIVATGDAAAPSDRPYRMSCQAAVQLGPQAAETVLSKITGRAPAPVTTGFAGLCISLGRRAGIFQFTHADDTSRSTYLGGVAGAAVKEIICRGIIRQQVGHEARKPGRRLWRGRDRQRSQRIDTGAAHQLSGQIGS